MDQKFRPSTLFFILCSTGLLTLFMLAAQAAYRSGPSAAALERSHLVKSLLLTDLCIFTEARYTRHPAMADNHAPFQEHPAALEHFPSGALLMPPARGVRKP